LYGGVADVLGDHGLAQAVGADQDEIAGLGEEFQGERPLDDITFDTRRPGPFEVGHGFELLDLGGAQAALKATVRALGDFDLRQMIEQLTWRPALPGCVGQHVIQLRGHSGKADPLQLLTQIRIRVRGLRRVVERVHRRSPGRAGGLRHSQLADGV